MGVEVRTATAACGRHLVCRRARPRHMRCSTVWMGRVNVVHNAAGLWLWVLLRRVLLRLLLRREVVLRCLRRVVRA